jgi:hypothetical protein
MANITLVNIDPTNTFFLNATDSNNANKTVFSSTLRPRKPSAPFQVVADNTGLFSIIISGNVVGGPPNTVNGGAAGHSGDQVEVSFGTTVWVSRPKT